jgi:hypothetical protein
VNEMDYVEYIDCGEYLILYRMYGGGEEAFVPAFVDGKPVRELADHVFAEEASGRYRPERIKAAVRRGDDYLPSDVRPSDEEVLCAGKLRLVEIPEGVEEIGSYAFYGCYYLKEIRFPSSLRRTGSGLFTACPAIRRMVFESADGGTPFLLGEIIGAVTYELEARATLSGKELWRLLFPEYYEESKENTPARIIEIIWHGMGYQYRNCFLSRQVQFRRYDALFPLSIAQESPETCRKIAMDRLRSVRLPDRDFGMDEDPDLRAFRERALKDCRVAETDRIRYVEYLREDPAALAGEILKQQEEPPAEELKVLDAAGFFTEENISCFIGRASLEGKADAVSFLMNVRRQRFRRNSSQKYEF